MSRIKHNGLISIWKFIFACMIMFSHFYAINDGEIAHKEFACCAIGVDFFFLVTGYLLSKKVNSEATKGDDRPLYKSTIEFITRKISAVLPFLVFSLLVMWNMVLYSNQKSYGECLLATIDFTFLVAAGFPAKGFLGGCWYLSAMILASSVVYPLHKKFGKNFSCLIAPLIGIFVGGYLIHTVSSMRAWKTWIGIGYLGLYKAFFEISLGCVIYELSEKLKLVKFTRLGKAIMSIAASFCYLFVVVLNVIYIDVRSYDWIFIAMLMVAVTISFSEQTLMYKMTNNSFYYYLEKLSTPMYLNNYVVIRIVNNFRIVSHCSWSQKCAVSFFLVIAISIVELYFIESTKDYRNNFCIRIKKMMFENS